MAKKAFVRELYVGESGGMSIKSQVQGVVESFTSIIKPLVHRKSTFSSRFGGVGNRAVEDRVERILPHCSGK